MTKDKDIQQRVQLLKKLIDYHRSLYHTFDAPELSDAAFDTLKNELEELERMYPQFALKDSPTQKVGGKLLEKFLKIPHEAPMLSFSDAFLEKEMIEWARRLEKFLNRPLINADDTQINADVKKISADQRTNQRISAFFCELKIDGLAVELIYERGKLVTAATRGDGLIGEDVTQNVKTIGNIPHELTQLGKWKIPAHCVIRGEIFISTKELTRINRDRDKSGLPLYANSRNLAAGTIRQLDSSIPTSRNLESFQYDLVIGVPATVRTHEEKHKVLASWGCTMNPYTKAVPNMASVFEFREAWAKKREKLGYEIDGVVVLVNNNAVFDDLGTIGKSPRGAIAYKFSPKEAATILHDVQFQVGRTGVITPVAVLKPVEVSGVRISHATLHNFDEIERLGVKLGDTVVVTRSGDVIPKITSVIKDLRTGKEKKIMIPEKCPVDHSPVRREGVFLMCSNPKCGARNRNQIRHFVSRGAFNIQGFGEKIVDRFLDDGLISHAGDIFFLREGDIAALDRFGEKSAQNLMSEIERARSVELPKFLYALGVEHVGEETARTLTRSLVTSSKIEGRSVMSVSDIIVAVRALSLDELQEMQDVGPKVANSIHNWFRAEENKELLTALELANLRIAFPKTKGKQGVFGGMRIAITGSLSTMSRQRAKELIEKEGGHFDSSITQQTNVVVAGENPGSKLEKARSGGIKIWTEKDFTKKLS